MSQLKMEAQKYNTLFVSSSGAYTIPEERPVYKKKFRGLSNLGNVDVLAKSMRGAPTEGETDGAMLHLSRKTGIPLLDMALFKWLVFTKGLKACKERKIDIIYAQTPMLDGLMACWLKRFTGARLVVGIHGDWDHEIRFSKPKLAMALPLINLVAKGVFSCADAVRVISKATEEKALEFVEKNKVCDTKFPALFDVEFFLEGKPRQIRKNQAVFVGSLIGRKGIEFLLKAIPPVVERYPDFELVILGKGAVEAELKALAGELRIAERVRFAGQVDATVVKETIDESAVLVLPSLSEGLGRIALEAMSRGRPVIGSAVEGIKESISDGKNGFLVTPGSDKEIAEKLLWILDNKEKAEEMGQNGRDYISETFSLERYVENHRKLFDFALSK